MTRTSDLRTLLASALILVGFAVEGSAETTLRWKFTAGQVTHYTLVQTQSMTTKLKDPDQEFKQGFVLTIDQTWTVQSVDASGVALMTERIDRIRTTADLPVGKLTYDSKEAKDAGSLAGPLFKMLVGAEFTFKMNPMGEITDIKLPEKMLAMLRGDQEPAGAQGQFSEAGLKNMVAQMGLLLPEKPIEPGSTWNRKVMIPAGPDGQTREIEQIYLGRGPEPSTGLGAEGIDLTIKFAPIPPDPNVPVAIKSQESKGHIVFDNATGRIRSSTVTEKVELAGSIMGKAVVQAGETTTLMSITPADPK